jgi:hypothetical protein
MENTITLFGDLVGAQTVVMFLMQSSAWVMFTPLPFDKYEIAFKAENCESVMHLVYYHDLNIEEPIRGYAS